MARVILQQNALDLTTKGADRVKPKHTHNCSIQKEGVQKDKMMIKVAALITCKCFIIDTFM